MLKESQEKIKSEIVKIIKEIGHISTVKNQIGEEFIRRNLPIHRIMNMWVDPNNIHTLSDSDEDIRFLFLFAFALDEAIRAHEEIELVLDPKKYFTQVEYNQWIEYKEDVEQDKIYPIQFKGMQQLADRVWQGTLTAQQLAELDADNLLMYNFKTQRNPKITVAGVKIDFDKAKSLEIKNKMLSGEQYPDHIKLNVLNNFEEKIYYNPKNKILTIEEGSSVNIFDGYHRKVSNSLAVEENPDIDFTWGVIITNLSETAAKDYMVQIDKQKPIKREQIKSWDLNKKENLVVSVIIDDKISKLNKVMKEQESEIKMGKGLVTKNIIAQAIAENYELGENTDIRALGNWIVEFTDYLFSNYYIDTAQENSLIMHKNMFYGYIALSAAIWRDENWKDITKAKMDSVDFNVENPMWREMGIKTKANKAIRSKIYKYFTKGSVLNV